MATGDKQFSSIILAILLGFLSSPSLFAQLHSRPASVMLIARLESLSVSATSAGPEVPGVGAATKVSREVAVRTSWAVPANCTTLRLVGGFSDEWQVDSAGRKAQSGNSVAEPSQRGAKVAQSRTGAGGTETLEPGETGRTLMSQGAESNRADSRTNLVNLELGRKKGSEAGLGGNAATFSVRVEAL
jgi:hypothetical protein